MHESLLPVLDVDANHFLVQKSKPDLFDSQMQNEPPDCNVYIDILSLPFLSSINRVGLERPYNRVT